MEDTIIVFTGRRVDDILKQGGTGEWWLSLARAKRCKYVVITRNRHSDADFGPDWSPGDEEHGSAFMVGAIDKIEKVNRWNDRDRYLIGMSKYAHVSIKDVWLGQRNPVAYVDSATLKEKGLDLAIIEMQPMPPLNEDARPEPEARADPRKEVNRGLTIAEAKRGLAVTFSVPEDAIEITIRG